MTIRAIVTEAVGALCEAFERGGYNPTPIIELGVLVANADGVIDDAERATLLEVYSDLLGTSLEREQVDHLVAASLRAIERAGAEPRTRLVGEILRDCHAAEAGVRLALAIAYASDGLSPDERRLIEALADTSGLPPDGLGALIREVGAHAEDGPVSVRDAIVGGRPR